MRHLQLEESGKVSFLTQQRLRYFTPREVSECFFLNYMKVLVFFSFIFFAVKLYEINWKWFSVIIRLLIFILFLRISTSHNT